MLRSSIGKKIIVAITGALLFGYLIAHMAGNLLAYLGADYINAYAEKLKQSGPLLWAARGGLLLVFVIHVYYTILVTRENQAARPQGYIVTKPRRSTFASRTMIVSGLVVFAFLIYHIAHFTLHWTDPKYAHLEDHRGLSGPRHDVYHMVTDAFARPGVVMIYAVALLLVFSNLSHGISSLLQTLGLSNHRWWPIWKKLGVGVAGLLILGFLAVPVGVLGGLIKPQEVPQNSSDQTKEVRRP
jgi:succinate dehydrogenase / fumarate reductase cytochrome b subunit